MANNDKYRFALGGCIVLALLSLAVAVALGRVEEKTSYGLTGILTILGKIALDFGEWAYRSGVGQETKEKAAPAADPGAGSEGSHDAGR